MGLRETDQKTYSPLTARLVHTTIGCGPHCGLIHIINKPNSMVPEQILHSSIHHPH